MQNPLKDWQEKRASAAAEKAREKAAIAAEKARLKAEAEAAAREAARKAAMAAEAERIRARERRATALNRFLDWANDWYCRWRDRRWPPGE